jgi:mannose-6-phosphate isomerase-like protein (cupin superfamily)
MNRHSFLQLGLAFGSFIAAPFALLAQVLPKKRVDKGIRVEAGKDRFGQPISLFQGDTFFTKVSTSDTNGDLFIFESVRDKKGGPPLHYHYEQDEWWYVLEGEFLFKVGDETFTAKVGDSVFGPRMVPHAFAKINEGPARLLMAFQPAGKMENQFREVSTGIYAKMTDAEIDKYRKASGFEVVGPALTYDKSKTEK